VPAVETRWRDVHKVFASIQLRGIAIDAHRDRTRDDVGKLSANEGGVFVFVNTQRVHEVNAILAREI
jgi:hypothetical protein